MNFRGVRTARAACSRFQTSVTCCRGQHVASARAFREHYGGEMFDPKRDRENGRAKGAWRRKGEYKRILESGPLSVHELLRN